MPYSFNLLVEKLSRAVPSVQRGGKLYRWNSNYDYSKLYVVFEFECYLKVPNGLSGGSSADSICFDSIDINFDSFGEWISLFHYPREKVKNDYKTWIENKVNAELEEDAEINIDQLRNQLFREHNTTDYITATFETLKEFVDHYHASPFYGWTVQNECFYTEDPADYENDDEEELFAEVYEDFSTHSFFADKEVKIRTKYHSGSKDPDIWYLEPDSSLSNPPEGYVPVEIVSSWIPGDRAIEVLREFKKFFESYQGVTDETTGFHINVRLSESKGYLEEERFNWLKLAILTADETDLYRFQRERNTYAKPIIKQLFKKIVSSSAQSQLPSSLDKNSIFTFERLLLQYFKPDKYHAINFSKFHDDKVRNKNTYKKGFVEFRAPGNDYLGGRYALSEKTLIKYMNAMFATQDPIFEKEYYFKLNRLYQMMIGLEKGTGHYHASALTRRMMEIVTSKMTFSQIIKEFLIFADTLEETLLPVLPKTFARLNIKIDLIEKNHFFYKKFQNNRNFWILAALYSLIFKNMKEEQRVLHLKKLQSVVNQVNQQKLLPIYPDVLLPETYLYLIEDLAIEEESIPQTIINFFAGEETNKNEIFIGVYENKKYFVPKLNILLTNILMRKTFIFDDGEVSERLWCQDARSGEDNTKKILLNPHSDLLAETVRDVRTLMNDDSWYIPAIEELKFIDQQLSSMNPKYRNMFFEEGYNKFLWSSTEAMLSNTQMLVLFKDGTVGKQNKDEYGGFYIVRTELK